MTALDLLAVRNGSSKSLKATNHGTLWVPQVAHASVRGQRSTRSDRFNPRPVFFPRSVTYTRDASGSTTQIDRYENGSTTPAITTTFTRDDLGRPVGITHDAAGTQLAGYDQTYDAASRKTSIDSFIDGLTDLTLDDRGRLTAADHESIPDESYTYDATGNRVTAGGVIAPNNKVLRDDNYVYEYDAEGNRTARIELVGGEPTGERTEYEWNHRNRLTFVRVYAADGTLLRTIQHAYDAGNNRIGRAEDTDGDGFADVVERFVVDGKRINAVVDEVHAVTHQYFHGESVDEILAEQSPGETLRWTLADDLGTIVDIAAVNATTGVAEVLNHRQYDSFGNLISQTDPTVDHLFGFTGRDHDESSGLYFYRDRWMDPVSSTFLSEDSIGFAGGIENISAYVDHSPYDYTDPTGQGLFKKLRKKFKKFVKKIKREVSRVIDQVGDVLEEAWDDTRDFVEDHPIISGAILAATGTWFVTAAGGWAAAASKASALVSKAVGSISTAWTPASSGIGGTFSVNVGNFASLNAGAGISGIIAFASANVSILGLPVAGIGKSVGALGKTADQFASTLVGNFTDNLTNNALNGTGIANAGSFLKTVGSDYAQGQLAATALPTAYGVVTQTSAFVDPHRDRAHQAPAKGQSTSSHQSG